MSKWLTYLLCVFAFSISTCVAQYAPQAGISGSTAIPATSPLFTAWATHCTVIRGYKDVAQPTLGFASAGDSSMACGMADNNTVSLGDSGMAILTFSYPIYNGPGADFAVFENGFLNSSNPEEAFLELAFVEVSSDGVNFYRFQATSLTSDSMQMGLGYLNARKLNNLAGKYIGNYGTPFDLQELAGIQGLDVNHITQVRIIDVIGSVGQHATYDSAGHKINDPYPTPYPGGGFDLDAVGLIHQTNSSVRNVNVPSPVTMYPNPVHDFVTIENIFKAPLSLSIADIEGRVIKNINIENTISTVSVSDFNAGVYFIKVVNKTGGQWVEKIVKE